MRLESLRVRGLGPFRDEVSIDLTAIPGLLVAVCGANGSGKSTLLELYPGALHRTTPTRGKLAELATSRQSFVEAVVVNGQRLRVRQSVDCVSGKGEALICDEAGAPLVESGKVRDSDAWISTHIPAPEVFFASLFAAQGSGGFLELKPAERKAVLLRVLGVEHLEAMAKAARERGSAASQLATTLVARRADEVARAGDEKAMCDAVKAAHAADGAAAADMEAARARLATADEVAAAVAEQARGYQEGRARLQALEDEAKSAEATRADLERRVANNRAVLEDADAIRAAVAELAQVETDERAAQEVAAGHRAAGCLATQDAAAAQGRCRAAQTRSESDRARLARLQVALDQAPRIELAVQSLPQLAAHAHAAERDAAEAEADLEVLRGTQVTGAEGRVDALRGGLERIAAGEQAPSLLAANVLRNDDEAAELGARLPGRLEAAVRVVAVARRSLAETGQALARCSELACQEGRIAQDRQAAAECEQAIREAEAEAVAAEADRMAAAARADAAGVAAQEAQARRDALARRAAEIRPVADRAGPLAKAEARLEELQPQLDAVRARLSELYGDLVDVAQDCPSDPGAPPDLAPLRAAVAAAERTARAAGAAIAVATEQWKRARDGADRLVELDRELAAVNADLADWTRLAADLGKDGLQALEIDAAGPELTELVNDLLHVCHGSRFTVTINTQVLAADGKRMLEGCEVSVLDTEHGREAEGATFSGGERVILGEALSLALSMLACRRAGVDRPTLIRDETGAALDPENGRVYLAMLRRAAQLVGAAQVLFVSHTAELQEMADARIIIDDGKVRIDG